MEEDYITFIDFYSLSDEEKYKELIKLRNKADRLNNIINELERLSVELNTCMIERNNYLSKIDKAIEYIEKYNGNQEGSIYYEMYNTILLPILSILKGEE